MMIREQSVGFGVQMFPGHVSGVARIIRPVVTRTPITGLTLELKIIYL